MTKRVPAAMQRRWRRYETDMTAAFELRRKMMIAGYSPLPVEGKAVTLKGWSDHFETNIDELELWDRMYPRATNSGYLCARVPTLDIDVTNEDAARAIEDLVRERFEEQGPILVRIGQAPKRAIPFRTNDSFKKITANIVAKGGRGEKIEFLCEGQQCVAFGIHPATGKPYVWFGGQPGDTKREDLPYIHPEQAQGLVGDIVELLVREYGYQRADVRQKHKSDTGAVDHAADWNPLIENVLAGLELHDSLLILAGKLVTAGMAPRPAANFLRGLMQNSLAPHDGRWQARYDDIERLVDGAGGTGLDGFKLKPFDEIVLSTAPLYLVKRIIPRTGLVIIWGPPKCGKSFWTFDLGMHIALGREYYGHRVYQGPVIYLALEGGHGFRNRVEAWRRQHLNGHMDAVPFFLLDVPVDLIADRNKLIGAIRAQLGDQVPAAVVVDTLNRALIGDENKSDDMNKFIRAADLIRAAFGCVVIVIHHCGVAGSRPRGHTSLPGADDAQIAVERDDNGVITVRIEYMKDGDASVPMSFRLARVDLGADDDGDAITSCVVMPVHGAAPRKRQKMTPTATAGLRALNECLADMGRAAPASNHIPSSVRIVTLTEWREYLFKGAIIHREGSYREEFRRIRVTLKNAGAIGIWDENVWAVT